ncbi:hypothetical protein [Endozoicomonas euniceicola]|uniref:Uncharacterized protein n=1 Tax=Endozoicomonas euniceicola TaxID=1234143 RepID=A0ABY6GS59_9GAMM|nr:hypothetical protein [Endozoicomonas euniceicola]UYM15584.1 hypothetical protein NX720_22525 [Endozoicomonas euniceicola]
MKSVSLPFMIAASAFFSGNAFCATLSGGSSPTSSELESWKTKEYYTDYCDYFEGRNPEKVVCGEEYCHDRIKGARAFDSPASVISVIESYNLASYIRYKSDTVGTDIEKFCVDDSLLRNKNASHSGGELEGVFFRGVLKLQEVQNGEVHYIPFKTSKLSKQDDLGSGAMNYSLTLSDQKDPSKFTDDKIKLVAAEWLAFRRVLNKVDKKFEETLPDDMKLDTSSLTLTVTPGENPGKPYETRLTGLLKLPLENHVNINFYSAAIRFAKPGFNNFRKNIRYKRSVSMIPDYVDSNSEQMSNGGAFKLVEIRLEPVN